MPHVYKNNTRIVKDTGLKQANFEPISGTKQSKTSKKKIEPDLHQKLTQIWLKTGNYSFTGIVLSSFT